MKISFQLLYRLTKRLLSDDRWHKAHFKTTNTETSGSGKLIRNTRAYRRGGGTVVRQPKTPLQEAVSFVYDNHVDLIDFCTKAKMHNAAKALGYLRYDKRLPRAYAKSKNIPTTQKFINASGHFYIQSVEWYINMSLRLRPDLRVSVKPTQDARGFIVFSSSGENLLQFPTTDMPDEKELLYKVKSLVFRK